MEINESFNRALIDLVRGFGIAIEFEREVAEPILSSASQVNILIGLTKGLTGNVLLGISKITALKIASMMIGSDISDFDELSESAVSEFMNSLVGMGLGIFNSTVPVNFSPPTMIIGESMILMISKVPSAKLLFKLSDETVSISISIE
jgi:chemotaxis protein CheX